MSVQLSLRRRALRHRELAVARAVQAHTLRKAQDQVNGLRVVTRKAVNGILNDFAHVVLIEGDAHQREANSLERKADKLREKPGKE